MHTDFKVYDVMADTIGYIQCTRMNDFPVIGDPCYAHRILGSPGGKHSVSLQRDVRVK